MVDDDTKENSSSAVVEVVGFGMVASATLIIADHLPEANTGTNWKEVTRLKYSDWPVN